MNKEYELYQQVVLSKSLPAINLQKGDLATIVEIIKKDDKTGYCLEFFDSDGNTLKVIIVDETDISNIKPHSIINYRELQAN